MFTKSKSICQWIFYGLVTLGMFAGAGFFGSSVMAIDYSASVTTSGTLNLDVSPSGVGANVTTDNVKVISSCPSGYTLSIAATSAINANLNDTTLYKSGDSTSSSKISSTAGTIENPVQLTGNNLGTWGFSMSSSDATGTFSGLTTTITPIYNKNSASAASGDSIPVYYGASVDNSIEPGLYKMRDDAVITYYLVNDILCTSYTVKFNANTGTGRMADQRIITGEETKLTKNTFTAPLNYHFASWNTESDGSGTSYTDEQKVTDLIGSGEEITLYAQWAGDEYTITMDGNGATTAGSTTTTATYNATTLGTITNPQRKYTVSGFTAGTNADGAAISSTSTLTSTYTFNGWYKEPAATNKIASNAATPVLLANTSYTNSNGQWIYTSDQILYAGWSSQSVTLPTITKTGYTCGWATSATATNFTHASGASITPTANTTLYGVCKGISYSIAFNNNGGSGTMNNLAMVYGTAKNLTTNTFNAPSGGYSFAGWNTAADGSGTSYTNGQSVNNLTTTNNDTVTLYAQWTYAVSFNNNGGSGTMSDQTIPRGKATNLKANGFTAPLGYSFDSWNTSANGGGTKYTNQQSVTNLGNTTLYAQWKYTVIFNKNGGTGTMTNQEIKKGVATNLKANSYTLANYSFKNWNTKADGTGTSYANQVSVTDLKNITLYAQWRYTVTFNANGGTGTMSNQLIDKDKATALTSNAFTYTNHIFTGWNTKADGSGISYTDAQSVINLGNITLYAKWAPKIANLDTGQTVNQKLKRLAGNSSATYESIDNTITALARSNTLPTGFTPTTDNTISNSSSTMPIYAWYDSASTTIYYYSDATDIKMNQDSSYFFSNMRALSDLSTISSWNTASVTNMSSMFNSAGYNATTWSIGDLSSWNTTSVTNMQRMFSSAGSNATTFTLDLSSWDTSSVTNMSSMFAATGQSATTFTLDLSSWNTASVTDMNSMFFFTGRNATTWSIGGLSSWNTTSVTDMNSMFYYAGGGATTFTLDLSSWDTSSVTNMYLMFTATGYSATTWSIGDLSSWNTASVTSMSRMFSGAGQSATTWSIGDLSSWNTAKVTSMGSMFESAGRSATTFNIDVSSWNTSSVTSMSRMFSAAGYKATTWSIGDLSSWDTASVTDMSFMFNQAGYGATTWSIGDLSSWNTASVTNMSNMFTSAGYSATTFTLDLSSWNTSSVTSMSGMFNSAGLSGTTWSVTIPKNNGAATNPITNTTSNLYGKTTSVTAAPPSGRAFTLAN